MKYKPFPILFLILLLCACGSGNQASEAQEEAAGEDSVAAPEITGEVSVSEESITGLPPIKRIQAPVVNGSLAYIEKFLGKRPAAVNLWLTEPLSTHLKELLGEDFELYMSIMEEAAPLKKDRVIYTTSSTSKEKVPNFGYLLIDTENSKVKVLGIFGDLQMEYQSKGEKLFVPDEVRSKLKEIIGEDPEI